ncbi:MAG: proprotein convertase P-domain-containing protein, partial [Bacteroidetes bacterium]|nr:proprotein convertase P-domain-containing protein [Bacteroidota bacterium]
MKKITLFILLIVFSGLYVSAQQRTCGMEDHMEELMKDPVFASQWAENQKKFNAELLRRQNMQQRSIMDEIVIPVAVHFPEAQETDRACLEALAQNQIDILNGDYTATNPDATLWNVASGFYTGVNHGVANIKFCIATSNHPENTDDELVEGGPAVTIGYDFGGGAEVDPLWGGYMNFLIKDIGGGLLGFSFLGGSIAAGQAVTMNLGAFGSGSGCTDSGIVPGAPYDLGRTTTHELGHFFNLRHPWGNGPGSCSEDDGIADTPNIDSPNFGCPNPGSVNGCEDGEFALTMSYMDYGDDACLYMFSEGQTDVVDAYVAVLEAQFKPNTVPVCVETPIYTMTDGTINTCNGIFYDSGGADGNYSDNEDYTLTICPDTPGQVIQLNFTSFETQTNADILSIYNADNADDPATLMGDFSGFTADDSPGTVIATGTNPTGCLTIVFTSSSGASFSGWQANISCQDPPQECQTIQAQLDSAFPAPNEDGFILVCPGEEITLTGSGTFSEPGGGDGATYQWETGDGTVIDGLTATFSFDEPGVYVANLNIWDTNTSIFPEGCRNTNLINQIIKVSTTPDFTGTRAQTNPLCFGDSTIVRAVVTPTPYYNECTPPESEVTFLPDGSGVSYETSIIVDCFDSDQTLDDINQLVDICLELEHSYLGDLDIEIISPSGQTVILQNQGGGSANLGVPWATGTVDGESSNTTPGEGYLYCFVPGNSYPTLVDGIQSGGTFPNGDSTTATYTDSFVPAGTYSSDETLDGLIGSSLNGSWTIRITDNIGLDNGYIFSWSLSFDPALQPPNLSFTPEIVSGSWADDPTIIADDGDTITIAPGTEGQFCYTYTALDNFDCEYTYEVCVDVLPEIIYDTPTDLLICDQPAPPYIFDLSQNEQTMLVPTPNPDDYVVTFHNSLEDAENDVNAIADIINYDGVDQEEIFVRFEYLDSNCFEIESFLLKLIDLPQINPVDDLNLCDDLTNDGIEEFDLEQQTIEILGGQSATDYVVTYYTTFETAEAGTDNLVSPYLSTSDEQGIYVRVQSAGGGGCFIVTPDPLFNLIVNNKATAATPVDLFDCDTSSTGAVTSIFDLEQQTATILGTQDPSTFTVTYHSTEAEAESGTNALGSPLTTTSTTIYVRVEEDGFPTCYETTQFDIIVYPNPEVLNQTTTICSASAVDLILGDDADGPSVVSY